MQNKKPNSKKEITTKKSPPLFKKKKVCKNMFKWFMFGAILFVKSSKDLCIHDCYQLKKIRNTIKKTALPPMKRRFFIYLCAVFIPLFNKMRVNKALFFNQSYQKSNGYCFKVTLLFYYYQRKVEHLVYQNFKNLFPIKNGFFQTIKKKLLTI